MKIIILSDDGQSLYHFYNTLFLRTRAKNAIFYVGKFYTFGHFEPFTLKSSFSFYFWIDNKIYIEVMRRKGNVLIVDDNKEILIALSLFLNEYFEEVTTESNPNQIPSLIRKNLFDLYILDMNFNAGRNTGNEGLYWMNQIQLQDPDAVVIFITAYGDIELSVKAIKQGATDFIQKPWEDDKLLGTILSAYELRKSRKEIKKLKTRQHQLQKSLEEKYAFFIGKTPTMLKIWKIVKKVSTSDATVLILGESGTGKGLLAREIHRLSNRSNGCFIKVDVGALSETLFESELFGYKKGAFTDAKENREGMIELASEGTLFLDEIGNIPLRLQSKLLSVLHYNEVQPIGANEKTPIDIRLITATNSNVYESMKKGGFREDLLYRINTIQIELPPLRERLQDIPELVDFFLLKYKKIYHKPNLTSNRKIIAKLQKYTWPGNIRELEHAIEKAVILSENNALDLNDFVLTGRTSTNLSSLKLEENEKVLIQKAIHKSAGNYTLAAQSLGISRKTLYNKIQKYDL